MMRPLILIAVGFSLVAIPALAQGPPGTDIFVARLTIRGDSIAVDAPHNVTARPGYDNQPSFVPDGTALLYTSIGPDGQADVWRYDVETGERQRLTATPESEYSPTVVPGGQSFSVVRVERDSTQRLWRFGLDGSPPELILPAVQPVGYQAWVDDSTVALFVLGNPATLWIADVRRGTSRAVAANIGRSLNRVPHRRAITFVHRVGDSTWITELDAATERLEHLIEALPGNEFHAWAPQGVLLTAEGSRLFAWRPGEARWREVADVAASGIRQISRLAVDPGGRLLALVAADAGTR